jgi:hypothetical protein
MPRMRKVGSFRRLPSDRLRLVTKMNRSSPVYVENKADCRQTLELLKWFPQSASREWTVQVIIEWEEVGDEGDVSDRAEKKLGKQEKGKKGRGRSPKKEEPKEESFRLPRNLRLPENFGLWRKGRKRRKGGTKRPRPKRGTRSWRSPGPYPGNARYQTFLLPLANLPQGKGLGGRGNSFFILSYYFLLSQVSVLFFFLKEIRIQ